MEELTSTKNEALEMMAFMHHPVEKTEEIPKRPKFSKATREIVSKAGLGTMNRVVGPAVLQGLILAAVVAVCGILAYRVGWASDHSQPIQHSASASAGRPVGRSLGEGRPALAPIIHEDGSKEMRAALWGDPKPPVLVAITPVNSQAPVDRKSESRLSEFYRTQDEKKPEIVPRTLDADGLQAAPNISMRTVTGRDGVPFKVAKVEIRRVALLKNTTLNNLEVRKVVRSHYRRVKSCLERQLKRDSSVSGKLTVAARVAGDGRVTSVKVETRRFQGTFLEECLVKEVGRWTFPNPARQACQVKFPLLLISQ